MAAVMGGQLRPAPARSAVPAWLRRALARGLAVDPAERWPCMEDLTLALVRDPARHRQRLLLGASAGVALVAAAIAAGRMQRSTVAMCHAGASRLAEAWTPEAGSARRQAVHAAFLATRLPRAAEAWDRVAELLDRYAAEWLQMYRDSCEATHVRGEQSAEVLDLRMACLEDGRAALKALTDVLLEADRQAVSKGVDAANGLPAVARCADLHLLRAIVEPPADATTRARVDELRRRAAVAKAMNDTGRNAQALDVGSKLVAEARSLAYAPLTAELLAMVGSFQQSALFQPAAVKTMEEATWTAIRSKRDDIAAEAASQLAGMVGYMLHRGDEGQRWADLADALLDRLGEGHELTRASVMQNRASIVMAFGDLPASLRFAQQALVLKQKVLPPDHPEIARSLAVEAETLHRMGKDALALDCNQRAQESWARAYGPNSAFVAMTLSNGGEYLVALGRPTEALPRFREALSRWEAEIGPDHPFLAYPLTGMGRALLAIGRPKEARAPLERALWIRDAHEPDPAERAETRFALAQVLWAAGDQTRAAALAGKAHDGIRSCRDREGRAERSGPLARRARTLPPACAPVAERSRQRLIPVHRPRLAAPGAGHRCPVPGV